MTPAFSAIAREGRRQFLAWVRGLRSSLRSYAAGVYVNNLEDEGEAHVNQNISPAL